MNEILMYMIAGAFLFFIFKFAQLSKKLIDSEWAGKRGQQGKGVRAWILNFLSKLLPNLHFQTDSKNTNFPYIFYFMILLLMAKIDEIKEYIGILKTYMGILVALIVAVGAGMSRLYLTGKIGLLFWLGFVLILLFVHYLLFFQIKPIKR